MTTVSREDEVNQAEAVENFKCRMLPCSVHLAAHPLGAGCLSVCLPVCLSACLPVCLCACLPVCLSACLPACLPACLSACLPVCLSACLPVCLSACLPVCLSACLPVCLSACLPVCLSVCLSLSLSLFFHLYVTCICDMKTKMPRTNSLRLDLFCEARLPFILGHLYSQSLFCFVLLGFVCNPQ